MASPLPEKSMTKLRLIGCLLSCIIIAFCCGGCAELEGSGFFGTNQGLDPATVALGLKDALRVGTERSVESTSGLDGFLGNNLIRIALPEKLQGVGSALRKLGMGSQVDAFEVTMNRAAEQAAGEATEVFWGAIKEMTLSDALGILNGGDTAATSYFRSNTSDDLRARFGLIVSSKMSELGLYRRYDQLISRYSQIPFVSSPSLDLDNYVTDKALGGLFTVLGQEETKIRRNPAARSTELLKHVFR